MGHQNEIRSLWEFRWNRKGDWIPYMRDSACRASQVLQSLMQGEEGDYGPRWEPHEVSVIGDMIICIDTSENLGVLHIRRCLQVR